ncbi:MAG: hypothetical protein QNK37_34550 [Acidobacteriota bacterium]|nr:hypothetical protein [Acidobacteriota bacterium]
MVADIQIHRRGATSFVQFLEDNDFEVEQITDSVVRATRFDELPVFINFKGESLYFEVDLCSMSGLASHELFFDLLDANTEILPVSVGVNAADETDARLVLVESRETSNLDENEIMSVFNALELATDKIEAILAKHMAKLEESTV